MRTVWRGRSGDGTNSSGGFEVLLYVKQRLPGRECDLVCLEGPEATFGWRLCIGQSD